MIVATIFSLIRVQTRLFYNIKVMRWYHIYCCWSCCCQKVMSLRYPLCMNAWDTVWELNGKWNHISYYWFQTQMSRWLFYFPTWKSTTTGNLLGKSSEAPRISRRLIPVYPTLRGIHRRLKVVHICTSYYWLLVWNMCYFSIPYIGNNNPNWRTHIVQRGWKHQPD